MLIAKFILNYCKIILAKFNQLIKITYNILYLNDNSTLLKMKFS